MWEIVTTEMSLPSGPAGPERETKRRVWHDGAVNLLDLVIILLVVLAIINGYRRGAALQITAYLGLLLGLLIGALIAPPVAGLARSPFGEAALALITLIAMAAIGDAIGWFVGAKVWAVTHRTVLGTVDSVAGSFVAIVAVLLTVWFIGSNLSQGPYQTLSNQIQGSRIIRGLDDALPQPPTLLSEVKNFLNKFGFPQVFAGLPPEPAGPVKSPTSGQTAAAAKQALASTVRIEGQACGEIQEGSGFVAASNYVITNAHVVAGVRSPVVQAQNGGSQPGTVVLYDPRMDIAILRIGHAPGPVLSIDATDVARGADGAVLGYPGGGPLKYGPGAVRRDLEAVGRDIYGRSVVTRDVYELQAIVRPGNSGGPFVLVSGTVAGVVFAASTADPNVGYALTTPQILPLLHQAEGRTHPVSNEGCTR
jgi:S1-C subfamily serine protease